MARSSLCAITGYQMSIKSASARPCGRCSDWLIRLATVTLFAFSSRRRSRLSGQIWALMFTSLSVGRSQTRTLLSHSLSDFSCTFSDVH